MRLDFLDFPTAWSIQKEGGLEHHPKCSAGMSMLCDCGAVEAEWQRRAECSLKPDRIEQNTPERSD